jgi:hypothetical protein
MERVRLFLESSPGVAPGRVLDEIRMISTMQALPVEDRLLLFVGGAFRDDCARTNAIQTHRVGAEAGHGGPQGGGAGRRRGGSKIVWILSLL